MRAVPGLWPTGPGRDSRGVSHKRVCSSGKLDGMATKFDRPDAWQALAQEDRAYWAERSIEDRSAAVIALSSELLAVQRQGDPSRVETADRHRRAEKLREWIALKERLRWPSAIRQNSKTSSAER